MPLRKSLYKIGFFGQKRLHIITKVLITSRFNDKILDDHFLVHEGCVIMMFYVPQELKNGHPKFYH